MSTAAHYRLLPGKPFPFGAELTANGCNFAVYSPDAQSVSIGLFDRNEELLACIELTQRVQSTWYGEIEGVKEGDFYLLKTIIKPRKRKGMLAIKDEYWLLDPFAKKTNRTLEFDRQQYDENTMAWLCKGIVVKHSFSPLQHSKPEIKHRVIYEAHVKGLSMQHPSVPDELKGTYLGACHPAVIEHIKSLGVTSVQFLPLNASMPEPFTTEKGLTNYWGYNTLNFFAAEPKYAHNDALSECRQMIDCYHQHGIEVILDVVFNHTCEAGENGLVISLKGLCREHAYLLEEYDEESGVQYLNYTGCGNTVKVSDGFTMNLILDAMRFWVDVMGVDGFRFDLAATLGRDSYEFTKKAAFFRIIQQDPILKRAFFIAEPWDVGPGGYQLGHFPNKWCEVNDKYRDTVRAFWRGDSGLKGEFATRLMGSRDIFKKTKRPMHASLNNITYHDGFTLHDLVCYSQKHNDANLEDNRDGHNHNLSDNYGVEGPTNDAAINATRFQQKRNMFASLLLSQGTPHVLAGDELSRTQKGNNNAYCQDNELSYLNWSLNEDESKFHQFCQHVIKLRLNSRILRAMHLDDDQFDNHVNLSLVDWYRRDGSHKTDIDWVNHDHHCFALHMVGNEQSHFEEWLLVVNAASTTKPFTCPVLNGLNSTDLKQSQSEISDWEVAIDTSVDCVSKYSAISVNATFHMPEKSLRLLRRVTRTDC